MLAEAARAASTVVAALQRASAATGTDFHYLLGTAIRESGLKPQAQSATSSASGLFQFVEQTWFGLVKDYGAKHGLGSYANAIQKGGDGHFRAADPSDRNAILRLRNDPQISALMAGEYARQTQTELESKLGRPVCGGELYAAHLLGSGSACRLIQTNGSAPRTAACDLFPKAAEANRSIFYHPDGTAKTVREVYDWTVSRPSVPAPESAAVRSAPVMTAPVFGDEGMNALLASMWTPRSSFFSSGEKTPQPFSLSSALLDVLSTVAKPGGKP